MAAERRLLHRTLPLLLLLTAGCWGGTPEPGPSRSRRPAPGAAAGPPARSPVTAVGVDAPRTVVFAVLDTVRADRTSVCGHERPTTPTLEAMVERGASLSCRAYAPAPWTHPSHASFFTGKSVTEHAAMWVSESEVAINPVTRVRPLAPEFQTVAESFGQRGYQTVAITANMIVTPASGLLQGFDEQVVTPTSLGLRGKRFRKRFRKLVSELDPKKPLFLFVNLYDAHDPYPAVPAGVSWLEPQARVDLHPNTHDDSLPYYRYVKNLSTDEEAAPFLERLRDGYDWGIHEADQNLGFALAQLGEAGWLGEDFRIVVTSDHGEMLGAHRLLRHGGYLYEGMVRVPMLYFDATADKPIELPEPVSGLAVHDLLLHGRLPPITPQAVSESNERDVLVGVVGGAVWDGDDKATCIEGDRRAWDLHDDPHEKRPFDLPVGHPLEARLTQLCGGVAKLQELPPPTADDPELIEALKAVGYMEDDEDASD